MNTKGSITKLNKGFGIYHDSIIKAPIEKVFRAVSEPEHLVNWWPLKCTGTPELGAEYNLYFSPEYNWYGKVNDLVPNRKFYIKMTKSDLDWDSTTFGFDMAEDNGNVSLSFSHRDWPQCNSHYRTASFCWAMLLKGLKDYLEKEIILPFEERS